MGATKNNLLERQALEALAVELVPRPPHKMSEECLDSAETRRANRRPARYARFAPRRTSHGDRGCECSWLRWLRPPRSLLRTCDPEAQHRRQCVSLGRSMLTTDVIGHIGFAGAFGALGYWLHGVKEKQTLLLNKKREDLIERRTA